MSEATGLARVLAEAVEATAAAPRTQAELQTELFAATAPAPNDEGAAMVEAKGRGRPPGALNKRTMAWQEFILATRGSPLQRLADICSAPTHELARALGCTPIEALKEQREAARVLLPYLHSPMPTKLTVTGKGAMAFAVIGGDLAGGDHHTSADPDEALDLAAQGIEPPPLENVEYQHVRDSEPAETNASPPNGQRESAIPPRS